jgi:selenocysteine-specific elongation factor
MSDVVAVDPADRSRILNINVGVLGHVDSGKTSLVKALSTSLSTAALDKNPQSQQRGITLDLGFSAFTLPLPHKLRAYEHAYDSLQFTLVDCPGHASLIRTIIGGAQIIDMMILVVDANKGIQTQTAECIVIGEITTDKMIIVLNKVDTIPEEERELKLDKVIKRIRKVLSTTKFYDAPIVPTSAAVGGEKVASIAASLASSGSSAVSSYGIDSLLQLVSDSVTIPQRNVNGPLYFAIDHCFAIKGHGTVVTGTVLSGSVGVNSVIEIPNMQIQRKVKSMQMFKKPVKLAKQGDRVGICVTHLDPKSIERGVAATPGTVPQLTTVLCLVKKVRFFKTPCKSNSKFHVSVGHSTVVGNVIFFGALEMALLLERRRVKANGGMIDDAEDVAAHQAALSESMIESALEESSTGGRGRSKLGTVDVRQSVLNTNFQDNFPTVDFSFETHYQYQEELMGMDGAKYGNEPVQWAVIQFQQPVFCPLGSLVIGSRLDADTTDTSGLGSSHQCRLSFFGPVRYALNDDELDKLNIFHWKTKEGVVHKISDVRNGVCTELIGWKMFAEGSSISAFIGMKVNTERGYMGTIMGPFGSDGMFRVKFEPGIRVTVGSALRMRFKRFVYDKSRSMEQKGVDEIIDQSVPEIVDPMTVDDGEPRYRKKTGRPKTPALGPAVASPGRALREQRAPAEASGRTSPSSISSLGSSNSAGKPHEALAHSTESAPTSIAVDIPAVAAVSNYSDLEQRVGIIETMKSDTAEGDGGGVVVVIKDAFRMEENIKSFVNRVVIGPNAEVGTLLGPFGKLGKCKAKFSFGLSANTKVGDAVKIKL